MVERKSIVKVLFCKISCMKYYDGATDDDIPYNGGSYVKENGYGHEQYNFSPVLLDGYDQPVCLGFVETKTTYGDVRNTLHVEKINGCEQATREEHVSGVLVVWCATTDTNQTSVVGWYTNATVYRTCEVAEIEGRDEDQSYNVLALKSNCVLLPSKYRHQHKWEAPVARKDKFGFGQSLVWYATEEKSAYYVSNLIKSIESYEGENLLDRFD